MLLESSRLTVQFLWQVASRSPAKEGDVWFIIDDSSACKTSRSSSFPPPSDHKKSPASWSCAPRRAPSCVTAFDSIISFVAHAIPLSRALHGLPSLPIAKSSPNLFTPSTCRSRSGTSDRIAALKLASDVTAAAPASPSAEPIEKDSVEISIMRASRPLDAIPDCSTAADVASLASQWGGDLSPSTAAQGGIPAALSQLFFQRGFEETPCHVVVCVGSIPHPTPSMTSPSAATAADAPPKLSPRQAALRELIECLQSRDVAVFTVTFVVTNDSPSVVAFYDAVAGGAGVGVSIVMPRRMWGGGGVEGVGVEDGNEENVNVAIRNSVTAEDGGAHRDPYAAAVALEKAKAVGDSMTGSVEDDGFGVLISRSLHTNNNSKAANAANAAGATATKTATTTATTTTTTTTGGSSSCTFCSCYGSFVYLVVCGKAPSWKPTGRPYAPDDDVSATGGGATAARGDGGGDSVSIGATIANVADSGVSGGASSGPSGSQRHHRSGSVSIEGPSKRSSKHVRHEGDDHSGVSVSANAPETMSSAAGAPVAAPVLFERAPRIPLHRLPFPHPKQSAERQQRPPEQSSSGELRDLQELQRGTRRITAWEQEYEKKNQTISGQKKNGKHGGHIARNRYSETETESESEKSESQDDDDDGQRYGRDGRSGADLHPNAALGDDSERHSYAPSSPSDSASVASTSPGTKVRGKPHRPARQAASRQGAREHISTQSAGGRGAAAPSSSRAPRHESAISAGAFATSTAASTTRAATATSATGGGGGGPAVAPTASNYSTSSYYASDAGSSVNVSDASSPSTAHQQQRPSRPGKGTERTTTASGTATATAGKGNPSKPTQPSKGSKTTASKPSAGAHAKATRHERSRSTSSSSSSSASSFSSTSRSSFSPPRSRSTASGPIPVDSSVRSSNSRYSDTTAPSTPAPSSPSSFSSTVSSSNRSSSTVSSISASSRSSSSSSSSSSRHRAKRNSSSRHHPSEAKKGTKASKPVPPSQPSKVSQLAPSSPLSKPQQPQRQQQQLQPQQAAHGSNARSTLSSMNRASGGNNTALSQPSAAASRYASNTSPQTASSQAPSPSSGTATGAQRPNPARDFAAALGSLLTASAPSRTATGPPSDTTSSTPTPRTIAERARAQVASAQRRVSVQTPSSITESSPMQPLTTPAAGAGALSAAQAALLLQAARGVGATAQKAPIPAIKAPSTGTATAATAVGASAGGGGVVGGAIRTNNNNNTATTATNTTSNTTTTNRQWNVKDLLDSDSDGQEHTKQQGATATTTASAGGAGGGSVASRSTPLPAGASSATPAVPPSSLTPQERARQLLADVQARREAAAGGAGGAPPSHPPPPSHHSNITISTTASSTNPAPVVSASSTYIPPPLSHVPPFAPPSLAAAEKGIRTPTPPPLGDELAPAYRLGDGPRTTGSFSAGGTGPFGSDRDRRVSTVSGGESVVEDVEFEFHSQEVRSPPAAFFQR